MPQSTQTNVDVLKINRGTYSVIADAIQNINEDELIITTDKNIPLPDQSNEGKYLKVEDGEYVFDTVQGGSSDNQTVKVGATTFGANAAVEFVAGSNIDISADSSTDTITIAAPTATTQHGGAIGALESASVATQTQSTKFLREDGAWAAPSYTETGVTDVTVNGTSVVSSGTAALVTDGTYNASTNKIATESSIPAGQVAIEFNPSTVQSTIEALTGITVGTKTYTVSGGASVTDLTANNWFSFSYYSSFSGLVTTHYTSADANANVVITGDFVRVKCSMVVVNEGDPTTYSFLLHKNGTNSYVGMFYVPIKSGNTLTNLYEIGVYFGGGNDIYLRSATIK